MKAAENLEDGDCQRNRQERPWRTRPWDSRNSVFSIWVSAIIGLLLFALVLMWEASRLVLMWEDRSKPTAERKRLVANAQPQVIRGTAIVVEHPFGTDRIIRFPLDGHDCLLGS